MSVKKTGAAKQVALAFGLAAGLCLMGARRGEAGTPFEGVVAATPQSQIDELVSARWQVLNLTPARPCSDAVFVRRVWLDVTGTLPTGAEAQAFILSRDPAKRRLLIDRLLASDACADYLALKWSDALRIKAEFPINLWPDAAAAYHHWVRGALRDGMPCDRFAHALLTASGSNFENPPVNFYRAMQNRTPTGMAQSVALTFLGERTENWPSNRLAGFTPFFANLGSKATAEWKEEILFFNRASTNAEALNGSPRRARLPDGTAVTLSPDKDPRLVMADWLVKDPQFARNIANRAWAWLLGRGIVQEPDDFRADNPPSNPALLDYLARELVSSGYDFKHLWRLILNSQTYQLAPVGPGGNPALAANFAAYPLRRLDAEVLIDAIDQLTGTNEAYSSAIPEPFTFIPDNVRSVALPDGSISSSFLELFGRPPRDTGQEAERNNRITAAQKLCLLNSSQVQHKLDQSRMLAYQTSAGRTPGDITTGMYLGILSRFPTAEEVKTTGDYFATGISRRQAVMDLAWALMNSTEFLYRH